MKLVLDSSAALPIPEPDSASAIRLIDEYRQGLHELLAPDIFPVETLNGLTKAERQKRILSGTAFTLWRAIMADSPVYHPHFQLLPRAYAISSATLSAIYDCVYVALAERENCEFVTTDDKLVNNLQGRFPFVIPLSSL
jgi:predicted nucleic acid-binding protein